MKIDIKKAPISCVYPAWENLHENTNRENLSSYTIINVIMIKFELKFKKILIYYVEPNNLQKHKTKYMYENELVSISKQLLTHT